jgi:hypothetical protein
MGDRWMASTGETHGIPSGRSGRDRLRRSESRPRFGAAKRLILCSNLAMTPPSEALPDDVEALKAALLAEQAARRQAEARASGAEAMVAHLKLMIAKLRREKFGSSSERARRLDQRTHPAKAAGR